MKAWIETYSGKKFEFESDKPAIDIVDISHGLSNICRFGGQCSKFYSVAQHSVECVKILLKDGLIEEQDREFAKILLLHDASEAYMGDMTKPLKAIMPDFKVLEHSLQAKIYSHFGVDPNAAPEYKDMLTKVDMKMLLTERNLLFKNPSYWEMENFFQPYTDIKLKPMTPRKANIKFIKMYNLLFDKNIEVEDEDQLVLKFVEKVK